MTKRRSGNEKDSGAALLLAIGFVVAIGAISGGLASLATSSLNNRVTIEKLRDRQFAADAAVENAITTVRNSSSTCATPAASTVETVSLIAIRVDWANACASTNGSNGVAVQQHNVIFTACLDTTPSAACLPANVIIRAQINFEPASGAVAKTYIQSWNVNR